MPSNTTCPALPSHAAASHPGSQSHLQPLLPKTRRRRRRRRPARRRRAAASTSPTRSGSPARIRRSAATAYRAFQVTCDRGNASLKNSFWQYQILNISYDESSFILATNVDLSDGTRNFELFSDASTDLGLAPFTISSQNLQLFFVYGCDLRERQAPHSWAPVNCTDEDDSSESFALLAGNYTPGDTSPAMPLPGNCNFFFANLSSMMPVLGYEGATGADYQRLLKRGFLLEYTDDGCGDCTANGGQCRIDVAHDVSWCHCSDDDEQPLPYICGQYMHITFMIQ